MNAPGVTALTSGENDFDALQRDSAEPKSGPKGWRTTILGTESVIEIKLSNPGIANALKRIYEQADSRLYWITLVAPNAVRGDKPTLVRIEIEKMINTAEAEYRAKLADLQVQITEVGLQLGEASGFTKHRIARKTPRSRAYSELFVLADQCMRIVDTLWIEGIWTDNDRANFEKEARKPLHNIAQAIGTGYSGLIKLSSAANKRKPIQQDEIMGHETPTD